MKTRRNKFIGIGFILIFGIVLLLNLVFGEGFNDNKAGIKTSVRWKYVNVRENPSTSSNIISSLNNGNALTLTGKTYEYNDGPNSSWVEILINDQVGWVVSNSVDY